MELSRRSAQFCWRQGSRAAAKADSSSMRTEDAIRCYSPQPIARRWVTWIILWKAELLFPLPELHLRLGDTAFLPFYAAYPSTSRLSPGLAPGVNDIVSCGDETTTAKVTT